MPGINEATDTDLKVIEDLKKSGWKRGDTWIYHQKYRKITFLEFFRGNHRCRKEEGRKPER